MCGKNVNFRCTAALIPFTGVSLYKKRVSKYTFLDFERSVYMAAMRYNDLI